MVDRRIRIARALRQRQTGAEEDLWRQLRGRRLDGWKFRRQMPIGPFVADFACLDARLVVELDGDHHAAQAGSDAERRRFIEAQGFFEIRFDNDDVRGRPGWVLQEIRRALDIARARAPRPPHARFD